MKLATTLIFLLLSTSLSADELPDFIEKPAGPSSKPQSIDAANDIDSETNRKPTNLIAFPNASQFIVKLDYTAFSMDSELDYIGTNYSKTENSTRGLQLGVMYAFNDYFAPYVNLDYEIKSESETTYGPATSIDGDTYISESDGVSDPTFGIAFRPMDMGRGIFDMNILFDISPKFQNAENASSTRSGNNAKGRTESSLEVEWGRRGPVFSWLTALEIDYHGKGESRNVENDNLKTTSSYSTLMFKVGFQWTASSVVSLDLSLGMGSTGSYDVKYADGTILNFDSTSQFTIETGANFTLSKDLYLTFMIGTTDLGDRNVTDETGVMLTQAETSATAFSTGLTMQF